MADPRLDTPTKGSLVVWLRVAAGVIAGAVILGLWKWAPIDGTDLREFATTLTPYRHAWYALPLVMISYVVLGLALVPVILLIAATGIVFGPWLGPAYAMAGCLASASTGFALGRWLGLRRVQQLAGERITRVTRGLRRNGTLAVFLIRKVPAPFTLVNIVVGASSISYRDFVVGTTLGMGAFVVALAGFGYQLTKVLRDPSPASLLGAALFVTLPVTLAWLINRSLRRTRPA